MHGHAAGRQTSVANDLQLQSIVHGVVSLEHMALEYGAERRRLRVIKLRGSRFSGGYHDFKIETGGVEVFPRLVPADHRKPTPRATPRVTCPSSTRSWAAGSCAVEHAAHRAGRQRQVDARRAVRRHRRRARREVGRLRLRRDLETYVGRTAGIGTDIRP
jgi:hypothetical protein